MPRKRKKNPEDKRIRINSLNYWKNYPDQCKNENELARNNRLKISLRKYE